MNLHELSLAELVGNPLMGSLYVSPTSQISALPHAGAARPTKGAFISWQLVTVHVHAPGKASQFIVAVGDRSFAGRTTITSRVEAVDLARGMLWTQNSIYLIPAEARCIDEPSPGQLIVLVQVLWEWGFGATLGLPYLITEDS